MTANRQELLRAANIVRPAIASQPYIKALTHLRLDEDGVTACDDINALFVDVEHDMRCLVPGDLFIKALAGFSAADVKVTPGDGTVTLKSGRGTLKLPTLPVADHPFKWPTSKGADVLHLDDDIIKAIRSCMVSVGNSPNHPAQQGVTLDQEEGCAVLFSTDNVSITRAETRSKITLPADAPLILPTFFCEQLLSLAKLYPEEDLTLHLMDNALLLTVGKNKAKLHSRQLVTPTPLDFPTILARNVGDLGKLQKNMVEVPPGWDEALQRAQLITASMPEQRMRISEVGDDLGIYAKSDMGELDEVLKWSGEVKRDIEVNPALLSRVSPVSSHLYFGTSVAVLGNKDATLLHVVATFGQQKK